MPTKPELEAQVKLLKSQVRDLKEKVGTLNSETGVLGEKAYGSYFHPEHKKWMLVELKFNPETKAAQVVRDEIAGDYAVVTFKMNEAVAQDMLDKMRR